MALPIYDYLEIRDNQTNAIIGMLIFEASTVTVRAALKEFQGENNPKRTIAAMGHEKFMGDFLVFLVEKKGITASRFAPERAFAL